MWYNVEDNVSCHRSDNVPTQGSCKTSPLGEVKPLAASSLVALRFGRSESAPKWNIIRPVTAYVIHHISPKERNLSNGKNRKLYN